MEEPTTITEESDDQSSVKSDESCGSNRVKFLCRNRGRILPQPGDGKLRYAGGGTRVLAVRRSIAFEDLIEKISKLYNSAMLLKCQLRGEDLDALVSVKSDEDLANILEGMTGSWQERVCANFSNPDGFRFGAEKTPSDVTYTLMSNLQKASRLRLL